MKAQAQSIKNISVANAATQLIVRQDETGKPLVFVADSLAKGNMLAWRPQEKDAIILPLSVYKMTKPIDDDKLINRVVKKYGRLFDNKNVQVRHRLFRGYDKEHGEIPVYPLKEKQPRVISTYKKEALTPRQKAAIKRYKQDMAAAEAVNKSVSSHVLSDDDVKRIATSILAQMKAESV